MPPDQQKKNTWSAICRGRTGALTSKWVFQEYERRDFLTFLFKRSSVCWSERGLREALETRRQGRGKEAKMQLTSRKKASGQRPPFEASTRLLSPDQIIWSQVAQRGGMSRNKAGGCFTRLSVGPLCLLFRSCRAATADRAHAATGGRALPTSCDFFLSLFFFARPPRPQKIRRRFNLPLHVLSTSTSPKFVPRAPPQRIFWGRGAPGPGHPLSCAGGVGKGRSLGTLRFWHSLTGERPATGHRSGARAGSD